MVSRNRTLKWKVRKDGQINYTEITGVSTVKADNNKERQIVYSYTK
jgi:hypothetical protein